MSDHTWDLICEIALAAEELSRCDRYIDAQESLILRDARDSIGATVDRNLLFFMRQRFEGSQNVTRIHLDVYQVPEAGIGLSEPIAPGLESTAVHALQEH
jgi:hypothetical protein